MNTRETNVFNDPIDQSFADQPEIGLVAFDQTPIDLPPLIEVLDDHNSAPNLELEIFSNYLDKKMDEFQLLFEQLNELKSSERQYLNEVGH